MKLKNSPRMLHTLLLALIAMALSACASDAPILPEPLVKPRSEARASETVGPTGNNLAPATSTPRTTSFENTPKAPAAEKSSTVTAPSAPPLTANVSEEANITVAFDQMPLPNFIQAIYGSVLKKTFSVDAQVASRKDLVTLRASALQTPRQIENAARLLLKTYGVSVTDIGAGNYRIAPDNTQSGYAPAILRGRALPDVPLPLRPIYQLVELKAVRTSEIASWLSKIFGGKVTISEDSVHNTLVLSGQSDEIKAVLSAITVLDQPLMKGRQSQRINPAFWSADELTKRLVEILLTEGYSATANVNTAGQFPISLIPITGINAVIVFASDAAVMQHILDWAKDLDKPNPSRGASGGYFTYNARFTNAESLAKTMQAVMGDLAAAAAPTTGAAPTATSALANRSSGRVVVNAATNTIIFQGVTENHTQLLNLLQELDKPAKTALIEVTVAEVSLDDTNQMGVEWALANAGLSAGANYVGGTLAGIALGASRVTSGIGIGTSGLTIAQLGSAGDLKALLNMLATSSKANVLSSPRVMARSGETASIQVGSEIPTINQQQTTAATGGTGVLQSVQYRKTGVILNVKPIIYSGDRIDLDVTQEVSDSTKVGAAGSPVIDTRKVETHLSLKDGTPVLLGGLISQNNSRSETGVPFLKDIPFAGQLFRTNSGSNRKTELLILITPYIVADDHDAVEITNAFRQQLGPWAQPKSSDSLRN